MSSFDELPVEIMLIIFNLIPTEKKILSQVSVRWKRIVENNFKFPLLNFFTSPRTQAEYEQILNSERSFTEIDIKVFPNHREQLETVKVLQALNPTNTFDISFAPARVVTPSAAHCLDPYLRALKNVENLTIKFNYCDECTMKPLKSTILMKNLKKLEIGNGIFLKIHEFLRAPNVEEVHISTTYKKFDLVESTVKLLKGNTRSLRIVTINESVYWYQSHLEIKKPSYHLLEFLKTTRHLLKEVKELVISIREDRMLLTFLSKYVSNLNELDVNYSILKDLHDVKFERVRTLWITDFSCSPDNIFDLYDIFPNATHLNFFEAKHASDEQKNLIRNTFKHLKKIYFIL